MTIEEMQQGIGGYFHETKVRPKLNEIVRGVNQAGSFTGYASYVDDQYSSGSPFTVPANTDTVIPNNSGIVYDDHKPSDIEKLYDSVTGTFPGIDGDAWAAMIYLKAVPSVANQHVDIWIDITGGSGTPASFADLYRDTKGFPRGSGVERGLLYTVPMGYNRSTWEANGGKIFIRSNAVLDIYGMTFNIAKFYRAP